MTLHEVITAKEAAAILGIQPRQVQNLCKSGKLDARYASGVWLIVKASLPSK